MQNHFKIFLFWEKLREDAYLFCLDVFHDMRFINENQASWFLFFCPDWGRRKMRNSFSYGFPWFSWTVAYFLFNCGFWCLYSTFFLVSMVSQAATSVSAIMKIITFFYLCTAQKSVIDCWHSTLLNFRSSSSICSHFI